MARPLSLTTPRPRTFGGLRPGMRISIRRRVLLFLGPSEVLVQPMFDPAPVPRRADARRFDSARLTRRTPPPPSTCLPRRAMHRAHPHAPDAYAPGQDNSPGAIPMPGFSIISHQRNICLRNQLRKVAHQCGIYVFLSSSASASGVLLVTSSAHQTMHLSSRTIVSATQKCGLSAQRGDEVFSCLSLAPSSCMQGLESGNSSPAPHKEIRKAWTHAAASITLASCRRWSSARGAPLPSTSDHSGERRPSSTRTSLAPFLNIPTSRIHPHPSRTPHDLLTRIPLRPRKQTLGGKKNTLTALPPSPTGRKKEIRQTQMACGSGIGKE